MSKPSPTRPTGQDVRAFYRSNPARMAKLSDAAQHTLAPGARGRLHASVIADYNKGRKPERQYVLGVGKALKAERAEVRKVAVANGLTGLRGPLSKAAQESLASK
jgi:hypothetical protein